MVLTVFNGFFCFVTPLYGLENRYMALKPLKPLYGLEKRYMALG